MLLQLPSQVFVIYKLFNYDKPVVIVSAILNIIISISLVQRIGVNGVLIGTFITSLIYLFSRFFIISKYVFDVKYTYYLKKILFYFGVSILSCTIIWRVCKEIISDTVITFIIRTVVIGTLAIFVPLTILSFTKEFKFLLKKLVPKKMQKFGKEYILGGVAAIIILIVLMFGRGGGGKLFHCWK